MSGFSAGGHLAAVLAIRSLNYKFPVPIRGLVLRAPMLSDWRDLSATQSSALKSLKENKDAPVINTEALRKMTEIYNAPERVRRYPEEFPLHLSVEGAKKLPPALIQVSQADPLRDEGILFHQTLQEAGVKTRFFHYAVSPITDSRAMPPSLNRA